MSLSFEILTSFFSFELLHRHASCSSEISASQEEGLRAFHGERARLQRHVCIQVWVNLGSLHLARNEAEEAARMYDAALNRFYGKKDSKVLLWLARAYYDNKDIKKSKMALLRAVHLFPHVQSLLFNLALTMQQAAALVRLRLLMLNALM